MFDKLNYLETLSKSSDTHPSPDFVYTQNPTKRISTPYTVTVKGYKYLFLNSTKIGELTPEEQLILIASTDDDVTKIPENTVAAIYKARQLLDKTETRKEAFKVCTDLLVQQNKDLLEEIESQSSMIRELSQKAKKLEYYLKVDKEMQEYKKSQASFFSPIINLKNKIRHFFNKSKPVGQPYSDEEVEYGKKLWEDFRKEQNASEKTSNRELLKEFRYGSPKKCYTEFAYKKDIELINTLQNEYNISTIVLQIIDGSAYQSAKDKFTKKNSFPYLKSNLFSNSTENKDERTR